MANQFDPANSPTTEPEQIVVGDFIQWRRIDLSTDYPNGTYTATFVARITGGGSQEIKIVGSVFGTDYLFSIASTASANFSSGLYYWQLEMSRADGQRIILDRGTFKTLVDLDIDGADPRTHSEIMLDKIETVLQGKADADVLSYSINGRSLSKMPPSELVEWRDYYKREFLMERRAERIRRKTPTGASIVARF